MEGKIAPSRFLSLPAYHINIALLNKKTQVNLVLFYKKKKKKKREREKNLINQFKKYLMTSTVFFGSSNTEDISLFRVDQINSTTITNKNRLTSHTDEK